MNTCWTKLSVSTLVHNEVDKKIQPLLDDIVYLSTLFLPAFFFNFSSLEKSIKIAEPRELVAWKSSGIAH